MAFVYFHKSSGQFQFVTPTQEDFPWNDVYEVEGATSSEVYAMENGAPVKVGDIDTSNPPPTEAEISLNNLRNLRNEKLVETDWWAVADRTMTQEQTDYRQALRDITDTYSSLEDVVWPDKPEI